MHVANVLHKLRERIFPEVQREVSSEELSAAVKNADGVAGSLKVFGVLPERVADGLASVIHCSMLYCSNSGSTLHQVRNVLGKLSKQVLPDSLPSDFREQLASLSKAFDKNPELPDGRIKTILVGLLRSVTEAESQVRRDAVDAFFKNPDRGKADIISRAIKPEELGDKLQGKLLEFLPAPLPPGQTGRVEYTGQMMHTTLKAKEFLPFVITDIDDNLTVSAHGKKVISIIVNGRYDRYDDEALKAMVYSGPEGSKGDFSALAALMILQLERVKPEWLKDAAKTLLPFSAQDNSLFVDMLCSNHDYLYSSGKSPMMRLLDSPGQFCKDQTIRKEFSLEEGDIRAEEIKVLARFLSHREHIKPENPLQKRYSDFNDIISSS